MSESPPYPPHLMPLKRQRTVPGSCWPCKNRRVKCDLAKDTCTRCAVAGTTCNYGPVRLEWRHCRPKPPNQKPKRVSVSGDRASYSALQSPSSLVSSPSRPSPSPTCTLSLPLLAKNDARSLDYFAGRLWPMLTTSAHTYPAPVPLAVESDPVRLSVCAFADAHRVVQDKGRPSTALAHRRQQCLASIRQQLLGFSPGRQASSLLVAVLFLYLLDGFIDCNKPHASTRLHSAGIMAIIGCLGGFDSTLRLQTPSGCVLLSEFVTTDLTDAVLRDRRPCFPESAWLLFESRPAWWEQKAHGSRSLPSVLSSLTRMACILDDTRTTILEIPPDIISGFEQTLYPTYECMTTQNLAELEGEPRPSTHALDSAALSRAFQHTALVYLYRVLRGLPPGHFLVQQHVRSAIDCVSGMGQYSEVKKCTLFPLFISGAHALSPDLQGRVRDELDQVYGIIGFDCVNTIMTELRRVWNSERQAGSWSDMFKTLNPEILVL